MVVAVRVRICLAVIPRVYRVEPGFGIEKLGTVCVPLLEHASRSLLRHPKSRRRTLDDGSTVKVVHRLDRGVRH
jgi:hypothetical protein